MAGRPVIPDEAVEAARARVGDLVTTRLIFAILEAAAPHLRELQWGVRDIVSLHVAGHSSEESAREAAAKHPEWYEVVSRPMPGFWTKP